jgi:hypothetical protein
MLIADKDSAEVWRRLRREEKEEFAQMLKDGRLSKLLTIWTPWWMVKVKTKKQTIYNNDTLS